MIRSLAVCISIFNAGLVAASDCCKGSAAIVVSLSGQASVHSGAASSRLAALDWLSADVIIETGSKSTISVRLANGRGWEFGEHTRATVKADVVTQISGTITELAPLPPIPKPAPIAGDYGQVAGAVRFRGDSPPRSLYPHEGATALPDTVKLSFSAVAGASSYRLVLADENDTELWVQQTAATSVSVPAKVLKPGTRYVWHAEAWGRGAKLGEAEAQFATISETTLAERRTFMAAIASQPRERALLASIDVRLGLLAEAVDEFGDALRESPDDPEIQRALAAAKIARDGGEK
jgi:hypothetical protein